MNEKIKEIIENEMDCLITDVDFVIKKEGSLQALVNMLEAAINYTHCCESDSEQLCDCAMPDPINPWDSVDKDTCRKCENKIA
tara:strand:+ start:470 stop:718 length:249 start_codon:yes stop_codon:yes gene_type:complete